MRKQFLFLFFLCLLTVKGFSQCEPNPAYTLPGIYPDSATGLPPAVATYEYNVVITAVIPADTAIFPPISLAIDSIGIYEILGLPEGFEAIPNRPSGYWHGGTSGCLLITGNPTSHQVGEYPLEITVIGRVAGIPIPFVYEITFYSIIILDSTAYGIPALAVNNLGLRAYPNPSTGAFFLEFNTLEPGDYDCLIYDNQYRQVKSETISASTGKVTHKFDGSNLKPGLYYCLIRHREKQQASAIKLVKY